MQSIIKHGLVAQQLTCEYLLIKVIVFGKTKDYCSNQWASIVKDQRWSWEGLLPYFKKSETLHVGELPVDMDLHGGNGSINVSTFFDSGKKMLDTNDTEQHADLISY